MVEINPQIVAPDIDPFIFQIAFNSICRAMYKNLSNLGKFLI